MSHHIVEARNLSYTYPDGTEVLKDISFKITHGESVAVVGANGAGKSTLLLHLNGYISPSKGKVLIGDYPINKETIQNVRRTVGMVFQNADDQLFMPTVFEDVAFGPLNLGLSKQEVEKRVNQSLEIVGALRLKDRPPYKLSGGEKRAVSIATILSMSPDILVMDEPTSNLDPKSRRNLIRLLKKFKHTKIIATHDLDMALDLCERTIIIHNGQITADGLTENLFRDKKLLFENSLETPLRLQACPVCG
ncbi:MAG: ATP-binding cassette domain-containing protein [Planctomycetia bacterium]|nr:ATP-binding cassette domain-containing protein [Planctomycetia bacterium]